MRKSWTDERLDERFDGIDRRFDTLERGMSDGFNRVDAELRAVNARFDALQRTMMQVGGGVIVALVGLIATQL